MSRRDSEDDPEIQSQSRSKIEKFNIGFLIMVIITIMNIYNDATNLIYFNEWR